MIRSFSASALLIACTLALGACTAEVSHDATVNASSATPAMPADAKTMQVGCYGCTFGGEGADGCQTAIMFEGKPVLVKGPVPDAHAVGLCDGAKQATVAGTLQGDTFVATAFSLNQ